MITNELRIFLFQEPTEGGYGYVPSDSAQLIMNSLQTINLSRDKAYDMAEELVMQNPRHRICDVALSQDETYMVRCWEGSESTTMTFENTVKGEHKLLYSQIIFKWKGNIPSI